MVFGVVLTDDAARDLEEIYDYLDRPASSARADHVPEWIEEAFQGLSEHPERGSNPGELLDVGIRQYREVLFGPYRIVDRMIEDTVYVFVIADG